jgi:hypothetical protein
MRTPEVYAWDSVLIVVRMQESLGALCRLHPQLPGDKRSPFRTAIRISYPGRHYDAPDAMAERMRILEGFLACVVREGLLRVLQHSLLRPASCDVQAVPSQQVDVRFTTPLVLE